MGRERVVGGPHVKLAHAQQPTNMHAPPPQSHTRHAAFTPTAPLSIALGTLKYQTQLELHGLGNFGRLSCNQKAQCGITPTSSLAHTASHYPCVQCSYQLNSCSGHSIHKWQAPNLCTTMGSEMSMYNAAHVGNNMNNLNRFSMMYILHSSAQHMWRTPAKQAAALTGCPQRSLQQTIRQHLPAGVWTAAARPPSWA